MWKYSVCGLKFEISGSPKKLPGVTSSTYEYEVNRIKTDEIREKFGGGVITSFIRGEGKPMGVIANNPHHIAGAIDSDGADKGARFIQLCDAFDIPILSLMDCPGMMVGPDVESTALVRHCVRMFNAGANLTTPMFLNVVRKAYGLGVQAMCGASSFQGFFTVAWPTAEFAGMAIEGLKPIVAIYSTFLQRAYDQLIHDVSLQNLNVIFAIDRAELLVQMAQLTRELLIYLF